MLAVVLVEPFYEENVGLIARVMKNFGFRKLILVNPKCNHLSGKAKSRAMHAVDILQKAKIFDSLNNALRKFDIVIATTAQRTRYNSLRRTTVEPNNIANIINAKARIALLFGREPTGLTNEEIAKADFLVSIPTSKRYPTLNITHAAAILLYTFFISKKKSRTEFAGRKIKELLIKHFSELAYKTKARNPELTIKAFKALISRGVITEKEASAVLLVLSRANNKIQE
ncbi:MAG: TrmJ/YjtD family RNA methyltransferase [Candidatus Diapherotrites archaeon]|nr:TrmJ/YjtD family RNA methyltransferase [Candidatus Diapherotrites archaeon]